MDTRTPVISVIMPTYKHEMFIRRAIASLLEQSFTNWELVVINDDSPDKTEEVMQEYLKDERIRYYRNKYNKGLGACLNFGLSIALAPYIAYLPSDDVIYKNHLQTLYSTLQENANAGLAFSFVRHHYNRSAEGIVNNEWLQLVQVMHKNTNE